MRTKKSKINLVSQLAKTQHDLEEIQQQHNNTKEQLEELSSFQKNMTEAKLTTRLQAPRVQAQEKKNSHIPEKYQYIDSLNKKGMPPEEIASLLSISLAEAQQLVALTKIANKRAITSKEKI
ncbi:hypothetical protein [Desulfotalea psychrophila]|nr:hypothetical protein [Desulfotalea psychrophila]